MESQIYFKRSILVPWYLLSHAIYFVMLPGIHSQIWIRQSVYIEYYNLYTKRQSILNLDHLIIKLIPHLTQYERVR